MKGHYFAVGSIAIVEVLRLLTSSLGELTGGGEGLNLPILRGGPAFAGAVFLYAMLVLMLLAFAMTWWVDRGRLGFGLRCIQQNEDAADMVGVECHALQDHRLHVVGACSAALPARSRLRGWPTSPRPMPSRSC